MEMATFIWGILSKTFSTVMGFTFFLQAQFMKDPSKINKKMAKVKSL